jgi:hypothetical protein
MRAKNVSIIMAIMVFMLLSGCVSNLSSYQSASSTKVGCPPKEVIITDLDTHGISKARDWVATCDGKSYYCSGVSDGRGGTTNVSCMEKTSKQK